MEKSTKVMNWVLRIFLGTVILAGVAMGVATLEGEEDSYQETYTESSSPF